MIFPFGYWGKRSLGLIMALNWRKFLLIDGVFWLGHTATWFCLFIEVKGNRSIENRPSVGNRSFHLFLLLGKCSGTFWFLCLHCMDLLLGSESVGIIDKLPMI